ncbi:putative membrane protein [Leifsonia sp. EB41]|uniref:DUF3040 domain-containing protein n=1 Tax=Leifsonia sp. EB41 TaxID=3156260 RepID=UPI003511DD8C
MTDDDPEQVRPAQEWVARQARRAAWTMIVLGGVAFIAGVVLLVVGMRWSAGFVGAGLALVVIGVLWLENARRTRAALDRSAAEGRNPE